MSSVFRLFSLTTRTGATRSFSNVARVQQHISARPLAPSSRAILCPARQVVLSKNPNANSARMASSSTSGGPSLPSGSSATGPGLHEERCEACRSTSSPLSSSELPSLLSSLPDWSLAPAPGTSPPIDALQRVFTFRTFRHALAFTNAVAAIAEEEKHHPAILTEWGKVTVWYWTHAIGGLHRNDFVVAAKTNIVAQEAKGRK